MIVFLVYTTLPIVFVPHVLDNIHIVPHIFERKTGRSPCQTTTTTKTWPHTHCVLKIEKYSERIILCMFLTCVTLPIVYCIRSPRFRQHNTPRPPHFWKKKQTVPRVRRRQRRDHIHIVYWQVLWKNYFMYVIVFLTCTTLPIVFVFHVLDNILHLVLRIFERKTGRSPCQTTTKTWPHTHCVFIGKQSFF